MADAARIMQRDVGVVMRGMFTMPSSMRTEDVYEPG